MWQALIIAGLLCSNPTLAFAVSCTTEIEAIERALSLELNVSSYNVAKANRYLSDGRILCLAGETEHSLRVLALAKLSLSVIEGDED
jgi:hypothetical protein